MKRRQMMAVLLAAALGMTGCSTAATTDTGTATTTDTTADSTENKSTETVEDLVDTDDMFSDRDLEGSYDEKECTKITLDDEDSACEDKNVSIDGQTVTITGEGTYLVSYEFDVDQNWDRMEEILKKLSGHDEIFYGTNREVLFGE